MVIVVHLFARRDPSYPPQVGRHVVEVAVADHVADAVDHSVQENGAQERVDQFQPLVG